MTSRTPIGVHPRPPQRTLSSSTLSVQRPTHQQRAISQQLYPSSPVRKDSFGDFPTVDPLDPLQTRHATTPRRAGSRLRLELSNNDLASSSVSALSSPQLLTPSRMVSMSEAMDGDGTSPALSRASQQDPDNPRTSTRRDARPKAWTVEIPSEAPRLPSSSKHEPPNRDPFSRGLFSGHGDFFPWTGRHYEDDWSVEAIQKGTWDRGTQNETSTARMAISPAIKQKSGLNALSTIFMGVLNQRRHRGQVTAPSTFKPPPRVTLTDTKREVWMKDLANPAISLRRLSRTIPHGIRGRTLLDQCLNKNVPTERAVWLAKCVGANEIRAFKRKGLNGAFAMGGEFKWIRDWTVFVEQFIDAVVSAFGETDWKTRVTYAIRLATNLYSEQLLDREHYLDWIVSGLEHSSQSRIPMWILIAQICWADLLHSRKYGRRLVYAFLNHLNTIHNDPDKDILIQLSSQLANLLDSLIKNTPDNFFCPSMWPKYGQALEAFLPAGDTEARVAYDRLVFRNRRLSVTNNVVPLAGGQQLVRLLDSTLKNHIDRDLTTKCWATSRDKVQVVRATVEWATSFHRPGLAKVYLAANLLRAWTSLRIDATSIILDHMDTISPKDKTRKQMAYRLVTELVRTGHFSVPQYIQWLIARGGCHEAFEVDSEDSPCATRLLVNLPLYGLSEDQKSDRGNILRRAANYSVSEEADDIRNAIRVVDHTLGLPMQYDDLLANRKAMPLRKLLRRVADSSWALQSSIAAHLRDVLTQKPSNEKAAVLIISPSMFISIRAILETVQDFSILSEVIKVCIQSANIDVLSSCVDTVNLNLQIFSAMGGMDDLFNRFMSRLKAAVQERGIAARPLLSSLACLANRMPGREDIAKQLTHDLTQSDRNNAIDACSPVSDNMVGPAQSAEGEVSEQIDKLLASGNSIDHPTMNRLFRYIVPRLDAGWTKMDDSRRVFASLLTRLRIFDSQHFDKLMADWVSSYVRFMKERQPLSALLPLLIITHCLPISSLLPSTPPPACTSGPAPDQTTKPGSATYFQELLQLILMRLPPGTGLSTEEEYRFRIYQHSAKSNYDKGFLGLLRSAIIEYVEVRDQPDTFALPLDDPACWQNIIESLRPLIVTSLPLVTELLAKNIPTEATKLIHDIMSKLLVPQELGDPPPSFDQVLGLANELTMPFCQIKLNLDLTLAQQGVTDNKEQKSSQFELFAKAMDRALEAQNIMWTSMLPCLTDDITQHLKNQARARFLELIPSTKSPKLTEAATNANSIRLAKNLLAVVQAIVSGQPPPKSAQLHGSLAEKLAELVDIIAARDQEKARLRPVVLDDWLPAFLRFLTLHSICAEPVNSSLNLSIQGKTIIPANHDARGRILLVLCRLLLELDALPGQTAGDLSPQVFDIALLLADALPDEVRALCVKGILLLPGVMPSMNTSSDPRLFYIFSTLQPTPKDNLMMAHREKTSMSHSAAYRGMGAMYGIGPASQPKHSPFVLRRWEMLSEPTPNVGENDTSLNLSLFEAIKIQ
ncbi:Mediator of RNA polymerase II transcription subunit 12 [Cladobotryum mycophilum]|uniref:Mediator of RNA polymerase II transcription subunit 12 n=1 Tax=Cladobotryum mycophilum TaxID=491253 RepID=A0ABR0T323_9HYPO